MPKTVKQPATRRSLHRHCSALVLEWRRRARYAFTSAKQETDPMGKRLIEHGAMCYFNCMSELENALKGKAQNPKLIDGTL